MPMTITGNGNVWNEAAETDTPFAPGNPIYQSYKQSYQLFNSIACGRDPLGVSPDQSVGLFEQKESVFHNASPGGALAIIKDLKGNTKGLKAIHIPSRMTQDQPYRRISEANNFLNISQSSHNPQLAAAFLKFYFSDDFYPEFIEKCATEPTMKGVKTAINPILAAADGEDVEPVWMAMFDDKYTAIRSYAKFDISSVASNFFIQDYDFEACMKKWNSAWADARKNLGYSK
jgi:raffinose/stachyose/melibiose transport system substrate-binding protein